MSENEKLFHLMAEKMRDLACDAPDFMPDDQDISDVFVALSMLIDSMSTTTPYVDTAAAALGIAAGEFSDDMAYHCTGERGDAYDYMLYCMVRNGILERLHGDEHTAYIRVY